MCFKGMQFDFGKIFGVAEMPWRWSSLWCKFHLLEFASIGNGSLLLIIAQAFFERMAMIKKCGKLIFFFLFPGCLWGLGWSISSQAYMDFLMQSKVLSLAGHLGRFSQLTTLWPKVFWFPIDAVCVAKIPIWPIILLLHYLVAPSIWYSFKISFLHYLVG